MTQHTILGKTDGVAGWYPITTCPSFESAQRLLDTYRAEAEPGFYFMVALTSHVELLPVRTAAA